MRVALRQAAPPQASLLPELKLSLKPAAVSQAAISPLAVHRVHQAKEIKTRPVRKFLANRKNKPDSKVAMPVSQHQRAKNKVRPVHNLAKVKTSIFLKNRPLHRHRHRHRHRQIVPANPLPRGADKALAAQIVTLKMDNKDRQMLGQLQVKHRPPVVAPVAQRLPVLGN